MKIQVTKYLELKPRFVLYIVLIASISGCLSTPRVAPDSSVTPAGLLSTPVQTGDIAKQRISDKDNMLLAFVPAGEFVMGSEIGLTDEQPAHTVRLDAFWIDQTEITNAMYSLCVESGSCERPSSTIYYNDEQYAQHPVVFVSWVDAKNYCSWVGRRLPTEAEWEKAATWDAATNQKLVYPWGNEFDCKKGNFDDETQLDASLMPGKHVSCDGFVRSSPVGSFPAGASPYGVLDMGGNVWEWVHDAFIETDPLTTSVQNYYAISPLSNPTGVDPSITEYRVMRGGSWNFTFGFGRSAYRLWFGKDDSYDGIGFRCADSE